MIARKDDACWKAFTDFDFPLAPFSFGRDALLNDRALDEAHKLGYVFDTAPIKLAELPPFKTVGI
jgi:hypothetical protein